MKQGRAFTELPDDAEQKLGIFGCGSDRFDIQACNSGAQIQGDPGSEIGQINASLFQVGRQRVRDDIGQYRVLVITGKIFAEQLEFNSPSPGVLLAVQGQQHVLHQNVAFTVH